MKHIMLDAHRLKFKIVEDVIKRFASSDEGVENLRLNYEEPQEGLPKSLEEYGAVSDFAEGVVDGVQTPFTNAIWKHLHYGVGARIGRRFSAIPISKRVKGYIIRSWYDGVEKIMRQGGLEMIESMLADVGEDYGAWDEISMNQFEVLMMGVTNEQIAHSIEDLGQRSSIPVDHIWAGAEEGTGWVDDLLTGRLNVYYAQIQQQTPNAIRLLVESRTEMPTGPDLTGDPVHLMEFLMTGKVSEDDYLTDIMFPYAGGIYKVPFWEVSGTTDSYAPYVDCPVIGDSFDAGDLVNPLMYDELNIQNGDYINSHRSNGYNPANDVLVDGLAVFADLCSGRYSDFREVFNWIEITGSMRDRTSSGVAGGIQHEGPFYEVQPGDTLYSIAHKFGQTVQALQDANGIVDPSILAIGQQLLLPGYEGVAGIVRTHALQPGENLRTLPLQLAAARSIIIYIDIQGGYYICID